MKVEQVKIKDFKVIKNLEKEIKGNNILLMGDNGVGKSSFMQFIEIALGKSTNIPVNAEGEGEVIASKDGKEYRFKVKFRNNKPVIEITSPDGLKDTSKGALRSITGASDFDIDEFVRLSETVPGRRKQVEIYKSLLPAEVIEFMNQQEHRIKAHYDERTDLNRSITSMKGFIKEVVIDNSVQPVDIKEIQEQLQAANTTNSKIESVKNGLIERQRNIADFKIKREKLQQELAEIGEQMSVCEKQIQDGETWLTKNTEIDTASLYDQINNATATNTRYAQIQNAKAKRDEIDKLELEVGDLTALIESSKQAIHNTIMDMDSPVDGLTFDADNLIYNGIIVSKDTLSTSEIMHLGCKLKMAQTPDLGILFIERGESLGAARLKEIQEMAKKYDWQIIMEQVERGTEELKIELMEG